MIVVNTTILWLVLGLILKSGRLTLIELFPYLILGTIGGLILRYKITKEEFPKKRENRLQEVYITEALPNTLLVDDGQNFVAYSGWLFITTTTENNYLGIIRLQDQFKVINFEIQKGSIYLIEYSREIGRKWHTLPLNKQRICLQDIHEHLENFKSSLHELIPGVQTRQLTFEELEEECNLTTEPRLKIDFIPETPKLQEDLEAIEETDQDPKDFEAEVQFDNELLVKTIHSIEE